MHFISKIISPALFVMAVLTFFGFTGNCFASATAVHENGCLTVRAFDRPLEEVLERMSAALDADIYVDEECRGERVTIDVVSVPVESALARILRAFSYAALYKESGSGPRLSGLKVYSRGKAGAPVALVKRAEAAGTAARTAGTHPGTPQVGAGGSGEATASGGARRAPGNSGVFLPAVPASTGAVSVSSVRAMEGLERERALHEEMRALEARASNEADEDAREALSISLIEKIQEFHQLQKANRNAQAALRRIELFHAQKAGGAVQ